MKKVISGDELKKYMIDAINLLCIPVKSTLGPSGNNVIINDANFTPFITNDGVTIAKSIEDDNPIINTILSIIKEASIKTNEDVGDGTTTTIVLLESIYKNSLSFIEKGYSTIFIKDSLKIASEKIINIINNFGRNPKTNELYNIACIAANDEFIGNFLCKFYIKMHKSFNIKIEENEDIYDKTEIINGYFLDTNLASPLFLKDKKLEMNEPLIFIFDGFIDNIDKLQEFINIGFEKNKGLIVFADDYDDYVLNEILALNYESKQKIILIKNPEYLSRKTMILEDLAVVTNTCINNLFSNKLNYGYLKKVLIFKDITSFVFEKNKKIHNYCKKLKNEIEKEKNNYEKDFLKDRLSKLNNNYGILYVGGKTNIERRERKMRFDDALCALYATKNKVVPGGGIVFYHISNILNSNFIGEKILSRAIESPIKQILINSNLDYNSILNEINNHNFEILYNAKNKTFESINETKVLDNKSVLINSLLNAISIAGLLLTTTHLVINEQNIKPNLNNQNEL